MRDPAVGERFRRFREYVGKTGPQLARELNVSKQTISAIEAEGRGLTREQIQKVCDTYQIDARYWFGQISSIEDADISRRDTPAESSTDSIIRELRELKAHVRPAEDIDPVAKRVLLKPALYELAELVQYWDDGMIQRLKDLAYGFSAGKAYGQDLAAGGGQKGEAVGQSA